MQAIKGWKRKQKKNVLAQAKLGLRKELVL